MTYRIRGLDPAPFQPLFEMPDEELEKRGVMRMTVTAKPSFPCRVTLEDRDIGERVIMRILVNQMRFPDPSDPQAAQLGDLRIEADENPPFVTLGELEPKLEPWLVRDAVELTQAEKDQVKAILQSENDIILALRNGRYDGVIDVRLAERGVLRQVAAQAES